MCVKLRQILALLLLALVAMSLSGCQQSEEQKAGSDRMADRIGPEASDVVTFENRRLSLEAYVWRDFMPGPEPRKGMNVSVKVVAADSLPFPDGIVADSLWLVDQSEVWEAAVGAGEQERLENTLRISIGNAPAWESGKILTVVVSLKTAGTTLLLQKANVSINATY